MKKPIHPTVESVGHLCTFEGRPSKSFRLPLEPGHSFLSFFSGLFHTCPPFQCFPFLLYFFMLQNKVVLLNVRQLSSHSLSYLVKRSKFGRVRWLARVFVTKPADLRPSPYSPHGGKRTESLPEAFLPLHLCCGLCILAHTQKRYNKEKNIKANTFSWGECCSFLVTYKPLYCFLTSVSGGN